MAELAERTFVALVASEYRAALVKNALVGEARVDFAALAHAALHAERIFRRVENDEARAEHGPLPEPGSKPRPEPTTVPGPGVRRG